MLGVQAPLTTPAETGIHTQQNKKVVKYITT